MRFGQLIANLAVAARGTEPGAIWDMEDEELREAVKWQLAELAGRRTGWPESRKTGVSSY